MCHTIRYLAIVRRINDLEAAMRKLSDSDLKAMTNEFRARLVAGVKLDTLLPEAFAVVREASYRVLGLRHFDVQLVSFELRSTDFVVKLFKLYLNSFLGIFAP